MWVQQKTTSSRIYPVFTNKTGWTLYFRTGKGHQWMLERNDHLWSWNQVIQGDQIEEAQAWADEVILSGQSSPRIFTQEPTVSPSPAPETWIEQPADDTRRPLFLNADGWYLYFWRGSSDRRWVIAKPNGLVWWWNYDLTSGQVKEAKSWANGAIHKGGFTHPL